MARAKAERHGVKLFLSDKAHQALKDNKAKTGQNMSDAVEELIDEVLIPEMEDGSRG